LLGTLGIQTGDGNKFSPGGGGGSHSGDTDHHSDLGDHHPDLGGHHSDLGGHLGVHHGKGLPMPETSYFDHSSFPDATFTDTVHHTFNHVEIPLWGGVTITPVALVALSCLSMVMATSVAKRVVLWRVGRAVDA
jgi:hypothetical protein